MISVSHWGMFDIPPKSQDLSNAELERLKRALTTYQRLNFGKLD